MSQNAASEVFTLEEAANYLKLPSDTIEREASQGHIPELKNTRSGSYSSPLHFSLWLVLLAETMIDAD